jgi:hypothetical protein
MPCQTDISDSEVSRHFEKLLCLACKHLTADQIDTLLNPGSGICDGLAWYTNHLLCDYICNESMYEQVMALKELNRLGYAIKKLSGSGYSLVKV